MCCFARPLCISAFLSPTTVAYHPRRESIFARPSDKEGAASTPAVGPSDDSNVTGFGLNPARRAGSIKMLGISFLPVFIIRGSRHGINRWTALNAWRLLALFRDHGQDRRVFYPHQKSSGGSPCLYGCGLVTGVHRISLERQSGGSHMICTTTSLC
jgi:hypothetical protein